LKKYTAIYLISILISCKANNKPTIENKTNSTKKIELKGPVLVILGTTQDAGSPQAGCNKKCCKNLFLTNDKSREVVSLGLIDPNTRKTFLFEATPDLPQQIKRLNTMAGFEHVETPDAVFLTHAHIGHYTGLMYFGKESMNCDSVIVYAMPRMKYFLEKNGPWSQLVEKKNISIKSLKQNNSINLGGGVLVTAIQVPHRDEFSETVGYIIKGPKKSVLFIPDIDKWSKWNENIIEIISKVDYAFIDGTFYNGEEIKVRNISEIPHPFVIESMQLFENLSRNEKSKINFIHFNHTNQLLDTLSDEFQKVLKNGFKVAKMNQIIDL
jgi:pyrroloquinoline quinone biosynthesis protein B